MPKGNLKQTDEKHLRFFREWLVDYNATRAYCVIYKKQKTQAVCVMASKLLSFLLKETKYKQLLADHQAKLDDLSWLKKEYVIGGLKELAERCMQKKPVMDFDYENKCLAQVVDEDGNNIWQFDSKGACKAFELLGKHLQLFTDNINHSGNVNHTVAIIPPKGLKKRNIEQTDADNS